MPRARQSAARGGEPLAQDVLKCKLKKVDARDYASPLSEAQLARLEAIFADGVCDYSRRGLNQKRLAGTWLSYPLPGHFDDDDFEDEYYQSEDAGRADCAWIVRGACYAPQMCQGCTEIDARLEAVTNAAAPLPSRLPRVRDHRGYGDEEPADQRLGTGIPELASGASR